MTAEDKLCPWLTSAQLAPRKFVAQLGGFAVPVGEATAVTPAAALTRAGKLALNEKKLPVYALGGDPNSPSTPMTIQGLFGYKSPDSKGEFESEAKKLADMLFVPCVKGRCFMWSEARQDCRAALPDELVGKDNAVLTLARQALEKASSLLLRAEDGLGEDDQEDDQEEAQ